MKTRTPRKAKKAPRPDAPPPDGLSSLERAFRDQVLKPAVGRGLILNWWREPVRLKLGGNTYYSPDFLVQLPGEEGEAPRLCLVEIKGFMRDDAGAKLKIAADKLPVFGWLLVTRKKKRWIAQTVGPNGIGREQVYVGWIHMDEFSAD